MRALRPKAVTDPSPELENENEGNARSSLCADGMVSIPAAADFLHVSRSFIYLMMAQGKLPYAKFGRSRRIPRRALLELADKSLVGVS